MICKIKRTVEKYGLIDENIKSVAVGFSGGADSVCLLDALIELKDTYGITLKAVHINHNIRGEEAIRDENFVSDFCKKREVELLVFSVDVPDLAKERKISLEECGRQVRYECFERVECDAVAVAHTLSDSIETFLFNLARGTGAKGLSGISPKRAPSVIRPLIECTRGEIEKYCEEKSLKYVTDSTNLSDDYTRNHIRHKLVPAFEKINADFEASFQRAMSSIGEQDSFVENCALELLSESKRENGWSLSALQKVDIAVLKKSILFLLKDYMKKPPEAKHIDACFSLVKEGKGKIELSKDLYILADGDIISFIRAKTDIPEWKSRFTDGVAETPFGRFSLVEGDKNAAYCFDADKVDYEKLYISSRQPGDSFTFKKRGVTKSLKKLFNEMKIPAEKRNSVSVLHSGENVVWIEDIGVNAIYIPDENTQKIITVKRTDKND